MIEGDFTYRDALPEGPAHRRGAGLNPGNRFEKIPGGVGIMLDDVMAGLYTNLLMQLALYLATRYNMPLLTGG